MVFEKYFLSENEYVIKISIKYIWRVPFIFGNYYKIKPLIFSTTPPFGHPFLKEGEFISQTPQSSPRSHRGSRKHPPPCRL